MNKFDLRKSYRCMTRSCPNKAAHYNESVEHTFLFCKFHRLEYFQKLEKENELKQMFTSRKLPEEKEISLLRSISYAFQAEYLLKVLIKNAIIKKRDIVFITLLGNFLFKEIRLFYFYKKLAHFQCPSIELIRPFLIEKNFLNEDLTHTIKYLKHILLAILLNPLLENIRFCALKCTKMHAIDIPRLKKEKNKRPDDYYELLNFLLIKDHIKAIQCFSLFNVYGILRMIEQVRNPDLVLLARNKSNLKTNEKTLEFILWPTFGRFFQFKNFSYYREAAMAFYRLGMYLDAKRCLDKAGQFEMTSNEKIRHSFDNGLVYFDLSLYERALLHFQEYMDALEDPIKDSYSQCLVCVVLSLMKLGKITRALEFIQKVKAARPSINLDECKASFYFETTKYLDAYRKYQEYLSFFGQCLSLRKSIICQHSPHIQGRLMKIRNIKKLTYYYRGECTYALDKSEKVLYKTMNYVGTDHSVLTEISNNLALMNYKLEKYHQALLLLHNARRIERSIYTKNCEITIETLVRMCQIYLDTDKEELIKIYMKKILKIHKKYDMTIEECPSIYILYAKYLKSEGKNKMAYNVLNAVRYTERYTEMRKYTKYHPKMIELNLDIASVINQLDLFEHYYETSMKAYSQVDHFRHPDYYHIVLLSAQTYISFNHWDVALRILTKAIDKARTEISLDLVREVDVSRYIFKMRCLKDIIQNNSNQ